MQRVDLRFESKTQSDQLLMRGARRCCHFGVPKKLNQVGVKNAISYARLVLLTRQHYDLELLVSRWGTKSHTFVVAWGEFMSTL